MSKRVCAVMLAASLAFASGAESARAESFGGDWTPEQRELLQDTLSLSELRRDVERIAEEQEQLALERRRLGLEIDALESRVADNRELTATLVRAQYLQSRRPMLLSLLNARSLGEFNRLYGYYRIAVRYNEDALLSFREDTDALENRRGALAANSERLEQVKTGIEEQQRRLGSLQEDIDSGLLASGDPASLNRLAEELDAYWNNVGLYEVDEYFSQLASASSELPDFLQSSGKLKVSGLGTRYTIELTDRELNDFLRSRSADFDNFSFAFEDGRVIAEGRRDRLTLWIEGRYTLQTEPQNAVLFHVDKLVFNGLELPESTRRELEQKYDLGFYPQQVAPVEVNDVEMQQGRLRIRLQLTL